MNFFSKLTGDGQLNVYMYIIYQMSESEKQEMYHARGNLIIKKIVDYPDEGLKIEWISSNYLPTLVSCDGEEADIYRYIKETIGDLSKAPGTMITISIDNSGMIDGVGDTTGIKAGLRKAT